MLTFVQYIWLEDDGGGVFYLNTGPIPGSNPIGITVGWVRQTQTASELVLMLN